MINENWNVEGRRADGCCQHWADSMMTSKPANRADQGGLRKRKRHDLARRETENHLLLGDMSH